MKSNRLSIKKMLVLIGSLFTVGLIGLAILIIIKTNNSVVESSKISAAETISQFKTLRG